MGSLVQLPQFTDKKFIYSVNIELCARYGVTAVNTESQHSSIFQSCSGGKDHKMKTMIVVSYFKRKVKPDKWCPLSQS